MSQPPQKMERRHHERRQQADRREEVRFEPGKPNRRKYKRRRADRDPWEQQATSDE